MKIRLTVLLFMVASFNANADYSITNQLTDPLIGEVVKQNNEAYKRAIKAINEKAKENQNIREANELYNRKHPSNPRVNTAIPNFNETALKAFTTESRVYKDDADPHSNPHEWDSIKSNNKICWFHKGTRRKVCEPQ